MKFEFRETQSAYTSGSQRAKAWTEQWVADWAYCPNCGNARITALPPNLPVADFYCTRCQDQFELKSHKKPFGPKVADGAFFTKLERLRSDTNPNLILVNYDLAGLTVRDVSVVPKHFFVPEIVEQRKPLAATARRAGWVGSNILLGRVPQAGRISVVRDGEAIAKDVVLQHWQRTLFLRNESLDARGWLLDVMNCIESLRRSEFDIDDAYSFEHSLSRKYPNNNNVRPKIRQQLQFLRDAGYLEFTSRGRYRLISAM